MLGNYTMHSSVELGGVITQKDGSRAMWSTMVNEGTGMRVLNQSLELRSVNTRKTPFFDTLSTASFGYGGEPNDVSYLKMSKGKLYDFSGGFRRDRNYFDYNLLANSLLSTATATNPPLVPEPDSLHLFNTVRRNTDALFTLFPISRVSFRIGYNHNTNEGPTYSSVHNGGDVQVSQWFRNALDTYTGGVDVENRQAHDPELRPVLRALSRRLNLPAGAHAVYARQWNADISWRRYLGGNNLRHRR